MSGVYRSLHGFVRLGVRASKLVIHDCYSKMSMVLFKVRVLYLVLGTDGSTSTKSSASCSRSFAGIRMTMVLGAKSETMAITPEKWRSNQRTTYMKLAGRCRLSGKNACVVQGLGGGMLGNLGTEQDAGVSDVAMRAATEPINLGNREDVSEAAERDVQEYILQLRAT